MQRSGWRIRLFSKMAASGNWKTGHSSRSREQRSRKQNLTLVKPEFLNWRTGRRSWKKEKPGWNSRENPSQGSCMSFRAG